MKKICIGYSQTEKESQIREAVSEGNITNIVYFSKDGDKTIEIPGIEVENRSWNDAILYRYFYPLLDKIRNNYLLIFDDMMRTQKRNDLTYNCCHHYVNQTENVLVFETFPMVENPEDFMILVDYIFPNRFKGQSLSKDILTSKYVDIKAYELVFNSIPVDVDEETVEEYEALKQGLFEECDSGMNPNAVPRRLHVWAGTKCKKGYIGHGPHVARNKRFKLPNVCTYKDAVEGGKVTIVDFPTRQINLNDFIKANDIHNILFLDTGLSVDSVYAGQFRAWIEALQEVFYVKTGI